MLTPQNLIYSAQISNEKLHCTSDDVFLIAVPVFHVFGMVPGIMSAISSGAKIVFMENYKAIHAFRINRRRKDFSSSWCSDHVWYLELNHPRFTEFDLSSLRTGIISIDSARRDCQKDSE